MKHLTVEELLRPRCKVVADYPGSPFKVGQVIEFTHKEKRWLKWLPDMSGMDENEYWHTDYMECEGNAQRMYTLDEFEPYPHLFRLLMWWEERDVDELPKYVKHVESGAIGKGEWSVGHTGLSFTCSEILYIMAEYGNGFAPATESEYLTFKNLKPDYKREK